MLAVAGVTAIEASVGGGGTTAVTVRAAVPLTPLREAVIVAVPAATPVARPAAFTVAVATLELVQVAVDVTFAVELSLYVAVAVNCCVAPAERLGAEGVRAMDVTVAAEAVTVRVAVALMPPTDAVIVLVPAATPVARPAELTVAAAVSELFHVTDDVTLAVESSLKVAVAVKDCVVPSLMLAVAGERASDAMVFVPPVEPVLERPGPVLTLPPQPARASARERQKRRVEDPAGRL